MQTISSILINKDLLGERNENFVRKYTPEYRDGKRILKNVTGALYFKMLNAQVTQEHVTTILIPRFSMFVTSIYHVHNLDLPCS